MADVVLLDGPLGTELAARGVPTPAPTWSALANRDHPEVVRAIHRDYAAAGAVVHTANTFRTTPRGVGDAWRDLSRAAVVLTRESVPTGHRVAGSIAPLEDCYRPDLSPSDPRPEHRATARHLAACGVDLLLVETFPHVGEALIAVEEALATGTETWLALTAGPEGDLLTPHAMAEGARAALSRGASAVLVNCVPARQTAAYLRALAPLGGTFGAYANAGHADDGIGWGAAPAGPEVYADLAAQWAQIGATIIGACCGTGPAHVRAVADRLRARRGA
jgi:S-methylmethionine-dependent homocysteine/selenocysteine methylase